MTDDQMMSTAEIAAALGITGESVRRHAALGHLPGAIRAGRNWRIPPRYTDPEVYRQAVGRRGLGSANRRASAEND